MRYFRIIALFVFGSICIAANAPEQNTDTTTPLKARYLYNFAKQFDWPDKKKQGNFVIGILNDKAMFDQMTTLYGSLKKIGSQNVEIRSYSEVNSIGDCNILYMPGTQQSKLAAAVLIGKSDNVLIVTEQKGGIEKGSAINIFSLDGKMEFELGKKNVQDCGLSMTSEMVKFAYRVL